MVVQVDSKGLEDCRTSMHLFPYEVDGILCPTNIFSMLVQGTWTYTKGAISDILQKALEEVGILCDVNVETYDSGQVAFTVKPFGTFPDATTRIIKRYLEIENERNAGSFGKIAPEEGTQEAS